MSSLLMAMVASGAVPAPSDPYFKNVTMLLHGDGTNGAQNNTFIDSSPNNFTITRNGNTTQGSFSPYGALWSNYFGPNTDALAVSGLSSASGDLTVEGWFYFQQPSTNNDCTFFGPWQTGLLLFMVRYQFGQSPKRIEVNWGGSTILTGNPASSLIGVWSHIAITRASGTVRLFLNGTLLASTSNSATINFSTLLIGREQTTTTTDDKLVGYASNVRVSTTTAFYTSAFTPSTIPLTAISGTSLLTCQSNRFIDNSSNNFTISTAGSPSVQRFSPFAPTSAYSPSVIGGSGYFNGATDYLKSASTSGVAFGTGDFTMEAWCYPAQTGGTQGVVSTRIDQTGGSYQIFLGISGTVLLYYGGSGLSFSGGTVIPNAWNHFACSRQSGTVRVYLNGVLVATGTDTSDKTTTYGYVAAGGGDGGQLLSGGYVSDARFIKGSALYTGSSFTLPTAPLTAVTNTQLLLNMTNAGILDNAEMNDLETVGNAQISTSVKKYGTGSLYFDGTGDYLKGPSNPAFAFGTGDYTVEAWVYPNSTAYNSIFSTEGNGAWFGLYGGALTYYDTATGVVSASGSVSTGTWTHVAFCRSGTTLRLFVNGVAGLTSTFTVNLTGTSCFVGYGPAFSAPEFNGYIDDLRITKGYARYTANFTPPAQAFPDK